MFSVCVFSLCFLSMFFFSICVFCLCYLSVLSVCVFCLCFLSGFAFYRTTKNDTFLSINFDIILLWSGLADQLLFADINSQLIWLQYKYKILTRYFGLSGSPASSSISFPISESLSRDQYSVLSWRATRTSWSPESGEAQGKTRKGSMRPMRFLYDKTGLLEGR